MPTANDLELAFSGYLEFGTLQTGKILKFIKQPKQAKVYKAVFSSIGRMHTRKVWRARFGNSLYQPWACIGCACSQSRQLSVGTLYACIHVDCLILALTVTALHCSTREYNLFWPSENLRAGIQCTRSLLETEGCPTLGSKIQHLCVNLLPLSSSYPEQLSILNKVPETTLNDPSFTISSMCIVCTLDAHAKIS